MAINVTSSVKRAALSLSTALLSVSAWAGPLQAQTITVDALDAPKAFTPGIEVDGALDAESWQGTSADRAVRLIEAMPVDTSHPIVRDMMRRVILSGLVPPREAGEAYEAARISAAQALASPEEYDRFAARNPAARAPKLRADAFITKGELSEACEISDALQQGRGKSYWIRLRAACHDMRGETASADLARDILRDRGEPADLIVPEPPEDFWVRAMGLDGADLTAMMIELAGEPDLIPDLTLDLISNPASEPVSESAEPDLMGPEMMGPEGLPLELEGAADDPFASEPTVLSPPADPMAEDPFIDPVLAPQPEPVPTFDLDAALADTSEQGTARLFLLGKDGDARAVAAFVRRAADAGLDANTVLSRIPAVLDPTDMAQADLPLFARFAAMTRDIALMQALFIATEDERTKERLALASDALGGGYIGRALGQGLETALQEEQSGAEQDVLVALALGANLEEGIEAALANMSASPTPVSTWIALDQAIDRGTRAETLLRLAGVLDRRDARDGVTLYRVLRKLRNAGLSDTAGQLAAYEYLRDL